MAKEKQISIVQLAELSFELTCNACNEKWSIDIQPDSNLPRYYWKCPKYCNDAKRGHWSFEQRKRERRIHELIKSGNHDEAINLILRRED